MEEFPPGIVMASVVADTHAIVWYIHDDSKLSAAALSAMDSELSGGDPIFVASMSLVELTYLVEKRRLPAKHCVFFVYRSPILRLASGSCRSICGLWMRLRMCPETRFPTFRIA